MIYNSRSGIYLGLEHAIFNIREASQEGVVKVYIFSLTRGGFMHESDCTCMIMHMHTIS